MSGIIVLVISLLFMCNFVCYAQYQYKNRGWSIEHWPMNTDDSQECADCSTFFMRNADIWTNDTAIAEVLSNLDADCKKMYPVSDPIHRKICEAIASVKVQIPPSLLDAMFSLSWPIPEGICSLLLQCSVDCCFDHNQPPTQVHLAFTSSVDTYAVSWVTYNQNISVVQYGTNENELYMSNKGSISTYVVGDWKGTIHRARMNNLQPGTKYYYRVGNGKDSWSQVFYFKTLLPQQDEVNFVVLGDMDYEANITISSIATLAQNGSIDGVLILGDESYADGYMPHWDRFFERCEQFAAYVPFMATPGNHEFWYNFTAFKNRFYSPSIDEEGSGSGDNMYYSFNAGHAHFVSANSETAIDTADFNEDMLSWLSRDVQSVDRNTYPFVITYFHRPMYCSNDKVCETEGGALLRKQGEQIFRDLKINLALVGHVHAYERTYPVFDWETVQYDYQYPNATVHILQGASGNRENNDGFPSQVPDWSVSRSSEVGFALMKVTKTQIQWSYWASRFYTDGGPYIIDPGMILTQWRS